MKKKKAFSLTSWIYFVLGHVLTFILFAVTEPTINILFVGSMIFALGVLGAIYYRTDDY